MHYYRDGFRSNMHQNKENSNKREEMFYRIKLHYKPTSKIDILTTFIYADLSNGYDVWSPDNNSNYHTFSDDDGEDSQTTIGGSIRLITPMTKTIKLTSITSFTKTDLVHAYDGDWANDSYWLDQHGFDPLVEGWSYSFYDNNKKHRKNFTQEFRLSKNKLIFGIFYKDMEEQDHASGYLFGGLATNALSSYDFKILSSYFQFDYDIIPSLRLSSNLRFEKNTIGYNGTSNGLDAYWESVELPRVNFKTDDFMIGYRSSLIFKRNNFTSFTSSFARGYKSGGVNQQPYLNDVSRSYGPEALMVLELSLIHI